MSAQHNQVRRSKLSFMRWPVEWLWIAVIVAVAGLVFVGLVMGANVPTSNNGGVPSPTHTGPVSFSS
jgi:hypothetical protein